MFTNMATRHNRASALERLGFAADGRDSILAPAVLAAVGLGGGLPSSLAASRSALYLSTPYEYTSRNVNSEILAALIGHDHDALCEALFAQSLPFSNPLEALAAAPPEFSTAESFRQDALVNQVIQRGREDALLSFLRSDALRPSFVTGNPASFPSVVMVTEPVVKEEEQECALEITSANALEALGGCGIGRRNRNVPYFDVSKLDDPDPVHVKNRRPRGGIIEPFPEKLHRMLREAEEAGETDVISFFPHGRAFAIHHDERFCREVMPRYFKLSRLSSFQRQLNLYRFTRITAGPDAGGYYHELFLKGRSAFAVHIRRAGAPKAVQSRLGLMSRLGRVCRPVHPPAIPDFYSMTPVKASHTDRDGDSKCLAGVRK